MEEYPQIVKEMIRGKSGVYALYRKNKLYYVGLASNLMGRLKIHLRDRHKGSWDRFSVFLTTHAEHMKELESLLLRISKPPGNKQTGKFSRSTSLMATLNRRITQLDADHRAQLLGGHVARRRRRAKTSKAKGVTALSGISDRAMPLRGWRNGWEYPASLRKNGTISYAGRIYDSPSAAGRAALRTRCSGWAFWHYKNNAGSWVPLNRLKR